METLVFEVGEGGCAKERVPGAGRTRVMEPWWEVLVRGILCGEI